MRTRSKTAYRWSLNWVDQVQDFHRQLFANASEPLRREIRQITGVEVREATAEARATTGTVVHVFSLAHAVPADTGSRSEPGDQS